MAGASEALSGSLGDRTDPARLMRGAMWRRTAARYILGQHRARTFRRYRLQALSRILPAPSLRGRHASIGRHGLPRQASTRRDVRRDPPDRAGAVILEERCVSDGPYG